MKRATQLPVILSNGRAMYEYSRVSVPVCVHLCICYFFNVLCGTFVTL